MRLGISGLGERAKKVSSFIVMAIVGGAVVPKIMGEMVDHSDPSRAFIVPIACFAVVAACGYLCPRLNGHEAMHGVSTTRGR